MTSDRVLQRTCSSDRFMTDNPLHCRNVGLLPCAHSSRTVTVSSLGGAVEGGKAARQVAIWLTTDLCRRNFTLCAWVWVGGMYAHVWICVCVSHLGGCVIASRRTPSIYYLFTLKVEVVNMRYTCRYDMRCDNVKNVWHFNGPLSVHCEPEGKFSPETECLQDCSIVSLRAVNKSV